MAIRQLSVLRLALLAVGLVSLASAQTGFTYQGRLLDGGGPANGIYDIQFALYNVAAGGLDLVTINRNDVPVQNGLFTTEITGMEGFLTGANRWLEVRVRPGASAGAYTTLTPRVTLTRTPYASYSFAPWIPSGNNLSFSLGNVGIGDSTPANTFTVGNGDKFQVNGRFGDVFFTDDLGTITFPETVAPNNAMIHMFSGGTGNADRWVIAHSANYPDWGLMYRDADDTFHFTGAGNLGVTVNGFSGRVGISRPQPVYPLHFANELGNKIALWGDGPNHYGFGIQGGLLQIYADAPAANIAFGYGSSTAFTERMRIRGSGEVLIGTGVSSGRLTVDSPATSAIYGSSSAGGAGSGVLGFNNASNGNGVQGWVNGTGLAYGIWGRATGGGSSYAGYFEGRVRVIGDLSASGAKPFTIDHPLDPENKYLVHYSMESPEILNVYRGDATFGANGVAVVELPEYFDAINTKFQYQLTAIGAPMPNLFVAEEIAGRTFTIGGGVPGKRVSWMVTAQRNDRHVQKHGAPVELAKPEEVRGKYLDPSLYGLPEEMSESFKPDPQEEETKK